MRASDQIKAVRSFVVKESHAKGLHVEESHWVPGYSEGHKETPLEAIDFAIEKAEEEMTAAQAKVVELHDLRATMVDLTKYDSEGIPYTDRRGKNLDDGWG